MRYLTILIVCFSILASCKKDDLEPRAAYVDFTIVLDYPQYSSISAVGGALLVHDISESYAPNGVWIYRYSFDEFHAYDNRCTYERDKAVPLNLIEGEMRFVCPECKSEYSLLDGSVNNGPAKYSLITYQTSFDGINTLRVYN